MCSRDVCLLKGEEGSDENGVEREREKWQCAYLAT